MPNKVRDYFNPVQNRMHFHDRILLGSTEWPRERCHEGYWITLRAAHNHCDVILSSHLLSRELSFSPCGCVQELSPCSNVIPPKEEKCGALRHKDYTVHTPDHIRCGDLKRLMTITGLNMHCGEQECVSMCSAQKSFMTLSILWSLFLK